MLFLGSESLMMLVLYVALPEPSIEIRSCLGKEL